MAKPHGLGWKRKSMRVLKLQGSCRLVFWALLDLADWKGRAKASFDDIAIYAGISKSSVQRALPILETLNYISTLEHGIGRRPAFYQVSDIRFLNP